MNLSDELATACGVRFLAHAEWCETCDPAWWDKGVLRLCNAGRGLFGTWLLAVLNTPEEVGV